MEPFRRVFAYLKRNSGFLSGIFFIVGLPAAFYTCVGLYQGVGLLGYITVSARQSARAPVPVWNFFVFSVSAFALSGFFFLVNRLVQRRKMPKRTSPDNANLQ